MKKMNATMLASLLGVFAALSTTAAATAPSVDISDAPVTTEVSTTTIVIDEDSDELPRVPAAPPVPPYPAVSAAAPRAPVAPAEGTRRGSSKADRRPATEEEKLAIVAIEGLMSMPAEKALPLLKKVLSGGHSLMVKERALFVLSQFDLPEAHALLIEHAKSAQSALRHQAIRSIGISGNAKSLGMLQEVYAVGDTSAKRNVLEAWMIAGRKADIYQVASTAKNDVEARDAIQMLSVMGATDELRKLGEQQKNTQGLVEAYAIGGDLASLRKIASGTGPLATRVDATRSVGIVGGDPARAALREIYATSNEAPIREAALQGLLIANDQQGVLALYRAAKTSDEKRTLLRTLAVMGGDAAIQAIDAALDAKK